MRLARGTPVGTAAREILRGLLEEIRLDEERLWLDDDPERLHDFRVALRRTRSALGQIEGVFAARTRERFRVAFRRLGRSTGPLRDLDVQVSELPQQRSLLPVAMQPHLDPMAALLRERRRLERARLLAALASPGHAALLRAWSEALAPGAPAPAQAALPVERIAAERILAAQRRVLERGRRLGYWGSARRLHRLRIGCKNLRYLLEFFGPLYDEAAVERLVGRLKRLQDDLGELNDLETQRRTLRKLATRTARREVVRTAPMLGAVDRLLARLSARQTSVRRRFRRTFSGFSGPRTCALFKRVFAADARPPSALKRRGPHESRVAGRAGTPAARR